jgi:hypothetical protein
MAIVEMFVEIFGAQGGPNNDSAPVYGDSKAPNGDWAYAADGKTQLMWKNGTKLVCVDPYVLSSADNPSNFVSYRDGKISYIRVWVFDPETKEGVDYAPGKQTWVEFNKLQKFIVEPDEQVDPEEPTDPVEEPEVGSKAVVIKSISLLGMTILFDDPIVITYIIE